jgi:hypothetical protein
MSSNQNEKSGLRVNIKTLSALAYRLGLKEEVLVSESRKAGAYYHPFKSIAKPPPFAKQTPKLKERVIDNPIDPLKFIQNRIYQRLLQPLIWPDHIHGGIKGRSLMMNVTHHLRSNVIVTLDIKSFFPNVTTFQIYNVWERLLECSPPVAGMLTRLTTFERHLPQGASTSSALANLVLYSLDQPIRDYCREEGILYTTWIDDLAFSGEGSRQVLNVAVNALRKGGFVAPHRKLRIMPAHDRQFLTGLLLNKQPGILRDYVSATRSGIYKLANGYVRRSDRERYIRTIEGRIAYIRLVNARRAKPLQSALRLTVETLK